MAIVAGLALAVGASQAFATDSLITASTDTAYDTPTPDLSIRGNEAMFQNNDVVTHTVTADDEGPDGKALFRTGNTPGGGTIRSVAGTNFLDTGDYDFHCSIHPVMQGTLTVGVGGAPDVRPEIEVTIKSKRLARVVKSGKLKVRVEAAESTPAEGIRLKAQKGKNAITKAKSLNLAAGGAQTAKLKLKKSAVEKLSDLDKAKVKVTGEVDFGSPAKAARKLK